MKKNIIKNIETKITYIYNKQRKLLLVFGLILIVVICYLDYITGYQSGFSIFYLIPIFIATLYVRKNTGIILSVTAAFAWLISDIIGQSSVYEHITMFDILIRIGFFSLVAFSIISLRRQLNYERNLARLDFKTNIPNSKAFEEFLEQNINKPLTVVYVDCDDFKKINDILGHKTGDYFLKIIAKVLISNIRVQDIAARLGGDEFGILLIEDNIKDIKNIVNRIKDKLKISVEKEGVPLTFSIGVAVFKHPEKNIDKLIHQADSLMFDVKHSGKDNVEYKIFE